MPLHNPMSCPCGRQDARGARLSLATCCGRYLADPAGTRAPDAESLMRSRYTAFTQCDAAYLLATWHPSTRPANVDPGPGTRWLGLEVRARRDIDATHAQVEFVARSRPPGGAAAHRLHERSRFVREEGRWYYLDGEPL